MIQVPCSHIQGTDERVWGIVYIHVMVCGVIHPCQTWPNASYNTHAMVGYHIHTCVIILAPLHNWYGAWFRLLILPIYSVTVEHVWGLVRGHAVVCGVIHPSQTWLKPHITIRKRLRTISIQVSSSLDHYSYTTDEEHGSSSWFQYPGWQLSMSGVELEVMSWSVWLSNPARCGPCLI